MPEKETTATDRRIAYLDRELQSLRERYRHRQTITRTSLVLGTVLCVATPIIYIFSGHNYIFSGHSKIALATLLYGFFFLLVSLLRPASNIAIRILDIEDEIDLLSISSASIDEQRAEKLFKLHQIELKKYYDQTLRHSTWIFFVGVACIGLGFGAIGAALYLVYAATEHTGFSEKIVIAGLGSAGGILANFIAVIYLRMFSETLKSLTQFHNRLVGTHHLHFGNFLVAKIKDAPAREKALSEIALSISKSGP